MGVAGSGRQFLPGDRRHRRGGFTLVEVVIVIIILGIVAAIAVPRLSRGTEGSADAALQQDLAVMQRAIEHYAAEHDDHYPDATSVVKQLTGCTDADGRVSSFNVRAFPYVFGPYLREVPAAPSGPAKGSRTVAAAPGPGVGWVYNASQGTISLNTTSAVAAVDDAVGPALTPSGPPLSPATP